jgi:hypothetical protein
MSDHSNDDNRNEKARVKPSHIAYQVRENGDKSYFNNIGAAFPHKDGNGFNVRLDALPKDGNITLRSFEERLKDARTQGSENAKDRGYER